MYKANEEKAGSNDKPKKHCYTCLVGKPPSDFLKADLDTGVVSTVDQCEECRAQAKKRHVESCMTQASQAPPLCAGPGLPWLNQCPFLPALQELHRKMNEDDLSEEERNLRMQAFSVVIDHDHLEAADKNGSIAAFASTRDSEEEHHQMKITAYRCGNCHQIRTSWFEEGSDDESDI